MLPDLRSFNSVNLGIYVKFPVLLLIWQNEVGWFVNKAPCLKIPVPCLSWNAWWCASVEGCIFLATSGSVPTSTTMYT